jgi:hypothetical protein
MKDVAEVRVADRAADLGSGHPECPILDENDVSRCGRLEEAGPAAVGVELGVGAEEFASARAAAVVSVYSPVKGFSVPASRRTWNSSGFSWARHSASVFSIFAMDTR